MMVQIPATDINPIISARNQSDKQLRGMCREYVQVLTQALLSNGAPPELMPPTKTTGLPHKGGYAHHPVVKWCSMTSENFRWTYALASASAHQYLIRFGKEHFAQTQLNHILHNIKWHEYIPSGDLTPFARAFGQSKGRNLDLLDEDLDPVIAYRIYMMREKAGIAKWEHGVDPPEWWGNSILEAFV